MSWGRSLHHCFCNFCKGNSPLSSFKVKQHAKIYGLWESKNSNDSSAAKKPKVDVLDISESDSDSEPEAYFTDDDTLREQNNDDFKDNGNGNYEEDLTSGPAAAKVCRERGRPFNAMVE